MSNPPLWGTASFAFHSKMRKEATVMADNDFTALI